MNVTNALLIADKKENIEITSENIKPAIVQPYSLKNNAFKLIIPNKELGGGFFSERRREAASALKKNRNFRTILEVAEGYFVKGVLPKAQDYYKQALAMNPQLFIAYHRLKLIALKRKDFQSFEENQRLLVESSNRRPDFLHEYSIMRVVLHPKDEVVIESSLRGLDEAIQKEPNNASYLNSRGFILLNFFQDIEKATLDFQAALAIDSEQVDANNNLGVVLMRKQDFEGAIQRFEACIRVQPKYQYSYQNLCFCYKARGMYHEALAVLKRASDAEVMLSRIWQHLYGWLLIQSGDLVAAQKWYANKILQEPNNNLLYNNLGACFLELENTENAILNFDKAIRLVKSKFRQRLPINRLDLQAFYNRGRVALDSGDRHKAAEICKDLLKIDSGDAYALYVEANNNLVAGKLQEALDIYKKSIEADPFLPDPYPDVAFIMECYVQNYQLAIDLLEGAVERGIKTALVLNNLAYAYIKAGQLDKAESTIQLQAESKRPEFLATKGLLSLYRMDLQEGDRLYSLAIERLKDQDKPMATQLWHYERAIYFDKKGDLKQALHEAELAKEVRSSYLNKNIQTLIDKLMDQVND